MSGKGNLKKKALIWHRVHQVGRCGTQSVGWPGTVVSAVRKHSGTGWTLCSARFLLNCVTPVCKMVLPTFKMPPTQLNLFCKKTS